MQTGKAAGLRNQCLKVRLLLCAPSPDKDFKYLSLAYGGRLKVSNILHNKCASGGIGRRTGLKILYQKWCVGSIPTLPTSRANL